MKVFCECGREIIKCDLCGETKTPKEWLHWTRLTWEEREARILEMIHTGVQKAINER